tara:strand:+ start:44 stop:820 length:777 start_codon:yes stop_codon:yes gene_type:complete
MNKLNSLFNLKDKVVVITGGAGYLCFEIAKSLHQLGCYIVILDKDIKKAKELTNKILKNNERLFISQIDVVNKKSFEKNFDLIIKKFKTVDVLINGAGINAPTSFLNIKEKEWDNIFASHLKGTLFGCQIFGKHMINKKSGSIINFSSASSGPPLSNAYAYSAAKAGIKNLSQNIAREWAEFNVRVNCLRPGFFPTNWSKKNFLDKKRIKKILNHTPMNRFGHPKELVGAVVWLSSDTSSFVTGAEIAIDGGFSSMTI